MCTFSVYRKSPREINFCSLVAVLLFLAAALTITRDRFSDSDQLGTKNFINQRDV